MKKKLFAVAAAIGAIGAIGLINAPAGSAACQSGPTPGAVVATTPDGVIYSNGSTVGSSGTHGYIEAGTDGHVQGSSTDVALEGKGTIAPSVCVNNNHLVG